MSFKTTESRAAGALSISKLVEVDLKDIYRVQYDLAAARCVGSGPYEARMKVELHEYLALAQVSGGRIEPLRATLEGEFGLHCIMRTPVPIKTAADEVAIFDWAHLQFRYPEEALRSALPGTAFVRIVKPSEVFHPNVSAIGPGIPIQALCLGAAMPPAIRLRELVLIAYGALTMQSVTLDLMDPAGVLNPDAALYWQAARDRIPLSTEPFLNNRRPLPARPTPI